MEGARQVRSLGARARSIEEALALGPALFERARADGAPWIAASVVSGPLVVLGAAQQAGRVVDLDACAGAGARVLRRRTTGTAAYVGGRAILWTLALPAIAALMADATAPTLLNRNVRPFLRGLRSGGLAANYFGREWIAVKHAPAALMGFDMARSSSGRAAEGAMLLEVIAGHDTSIAIPDALAAPLERSIDRWRGKAPAALVDLAPTPRAPEDLARLVLDAFALQEGTGLEESSLDPSIPASIVTPVGDPLDPAPRDLALASPLRVPIGWLDAASGGEPRRAWVGGDVLAPRWLLEAAAQSEATGEPPPGDLNDAAMFGATLDDVRAAVRSALDRA